jgi:hypothetical protein
MQVAPKPKDYPSLIQFLTIGFPDVKSLYDVKDKE